MHGDGARLPGEARGGRPPPLTAVVQRVVKPFGLDARARRRVPDIDRVAVPAHAEDVEVGLTLEAELLPGLATVAAADEPERIHEAGARRGVAAAVEVARSP